jgi:hypothetical protein
MSKPNEYVADLLKKLREDISQIKHRLFTEKPKSESDSTRSPRQYVIDAVQKNTESEEKEDGTIRATLHLPEAIRVQTKTDDSGTNPGTDGTNPISNASGWPTFFHTLLVTSNLASPI